MLRIIVEDDRDREMFPSESPRGACRIPQAVTTSSFPGVYAAV